MAGGRSASKGSIVRKGGIDNRQVTKVRDATSLGGRTGKGKIKVAQDPGVAASGAVYGDVQLLTERALFAAL